MNLKTASKAEIVAYIDGWLTAAKWQRPAYEIPQDQWWKNPFNPTNEKELRTAKAWDNGHLDAHISQPDDVIYRYRSK